MEELPVIVKLPSAFTVQIGRVIIRYAYLEFALSRIIYRLLKVSPKEGRLAIKEPSSTERFELIRDLCELNGLTLQADLKLIADALSSIQQQRNQLAHGIWVRQPQTKKIFLRHTKGSWQPMKGQRGKTKRVIKPEAIELIPDDLRTFVKIINETISHINSLYEQINAAMLKK